MNLKHLTDKALLTDTKHLVRQERALIAQVLWHLKEVDVRKLFSELRYSSLFDYCVKELGYSESSAQRRIVAARMLKDTPEIAHKIETGKLTLTNVSLVQSAFTLEERPAILKRIENKSSSEVKELIREVKQQPKTYTVTMTEEEFKLWQEMKNLGVDLKQVVTQAKKTKLNSMVKKEVFQRDQQRCQQCGGNHRLEFDHRQPKALLGNNNSDNLRLLCRNCNQRKRIAAGLLRSGSSKKPVRLRDRDSMQGTPNNIAIGLRSDQVWSFKQIK